jgi:RNAse (barnase) inhibitor barstar
LTLPTIADTDSKCHKTKVKALLPYIIDRIEKSKARYEVHSFDSGAVMVDIYIEEKFYVIQIDGDKIGLSLNTEETGLFDILPDKVFEEAGEFKTEFEKIFDIITVTINGSNFSTTEGFYVEVDNVLTMDLDWQTGHNLNAFNDLLRGGFGVHEYEEPIKIVWVNSEKSKKDLSEIIDGQTFYQIIVDIISDHAHVEFIEA